MGTSTMNENRGHIVGIGGIFFKAEHPEKLQNWYAANFGFTTQVPYSSDDTAINFRWKTVEDHPHNTVWAPFPQESDYFKPSTKNWMINYIVRDLQGLLQKLESQGISPIEGIKEFDFGKFTWLLDPEGNKIELWEPDERFFSDRYP